MLQTTCNQRTMFTRGRIHQECGSPCHDDKFKWKNELNSGKMNSCHLEIRHSSHDRSSRVGIYTHCKFLIITYYVLYILSRAWASQKFATPNACWPYTWNTFLLNILCPGVARSYQPPTAPLSRFSPSQFTPSSPLPLTQHTHLWQLGAGPPASGDDGDEKEDEQLAVILKVSASEQLSNPLLIF